MFLVYELWNPLDRNCFYVGKGNSARTRLHDHLRQARYLREGKKLTDNNPIKAGTIRKIIEAGLLPEYRVVFRSEDEKEVLAKEIKLIALYGRRNLGTGTLANMTDGGEGIVGWKYTEESKARRSAASKGRKLSEETKEKMRQAAKGRKLSEETRRKISAAQMGRKRKPETVEKIRAGNLGKVMSPEARAKISAGHQGKSLSEYHKQCISEGRKGKPWTQARRDAQSKRRT